MLIKGATEIYQARHIYTLFKGTILRTYVRTQGVLFSPLRSIAADGFIAWRNSLSVRPFVKLGE